MKQVLTLALFAGAVAQGAGLTVWTSMTESELDWLKTQCGAFTTQTGQQVTVVTMPAADMRVRMINGAAKGEGPDVMVGVPHEWAAELANFGVLQPVSSDLTDAQRADIDKPALDALTFKGRLFGFPLSGETVALLYNKKLVPEAPKNWDEFLVLARKLNNPAQGTFGFFTDLSSPFLNHGILSAYGGYIFKNNEGMLDVHDVGIANAGAVQGVTFLRDLRYKHNLVPEGVDAHLAREAFLDGQVGMYVSGPWDLPDIQKRGIDVGVTAFPKPPGAANRWAPLMNVSAVVVGSYSKNKETAVALAKALVSPESSLAYNRASSRILTNKTARKALASDPVVTGFGKMFSIGIPAPWVPETSAVWGPLGAALQQSTTRQDVNVQQVLQEALKAIQSKIGR